MVVGKDFTTVSGDILDFLKSISGIHTCIYSCTLIIQVNQWFIAIDLKSCVFSFACDSPTNPLYLEALEERYSALSIM